MNYFAYGSNMLTRRLTAPSRAPSAVACGVAEVQGFVVRFHKMGADGSGKCTLVATGDAAAVAYGVLYELTDSDGAKLDRVEGVHTGGYLRRPIQLRRHDGGTIGAVTYVASERHVDPACVPFDWYRDLVVAGAKKHGLPASYVEEFARIPAIPDPDSARAAQARRLLEPDQPTRETGKSILGDLGRGSVRLLEPIVGARYMRTRAMTVAEFQFLRDVQIRPRWGWPATFSCNQRREVWPSTRLGVTPEDERDPMEGVRALLDEIVDDVLDVRPRGGRFHINDQGVFLASDSRQVTRFLLRK